MAVYKRVLLRLPVEDDDMLGLLLENESILLLSNGLPLNELLDLLLLLPS